jgi:hypothetical protein
LLATSRAADATAGELSIVKVVRRVRRKTQERGPARQLDVVGVGSLAVAHACTTLLWHAWHPGTLYKLQDASKSLTRTGWVDRVAKPGRMENGPAAKMFPNALGSLVDKLSSAT